jgi:hypothetical protein
LSATPFYGPGPVRLMWMCAESLLKNAELRIQNSEYAGLRESEIRGSV